MKKCSHLLFLVLCIINCKSFAYMSLESTAFTMNTFIPNEYTCNGNDESPPLKWKNIPPNTKSLVLIMDDPDAPTGTWTHWILFNISPSIKYLDAGSPVPPGAANGKNSWNGLGYRGPCPPFGAHTYHFQLYALDKELDLGEGTTRSYILDAMTGHVLDSAELVGIYQKL